MSAVQRHIKMPMEITCDIAGNEAVLDVSGAVYFPADELLVIADMHLEKGTAWAKRGIFLPPYDSKLTIVALQKVVAKFLPKRILFLGDSFHDKTAALRLQTVELEALNQIAAKQELIWVTGNHDPQIPDMITGTCCDEMHVGGLHFTHIPTKNYEAGGQVSGHLHPAAHVIGRGRSIRRRCFITDSKRMIVPAFGAYTGGLSIKDKAFDGLFDKPLTRIFVLGDDEVFPMTLRG